MCYFGSLDLYVKTNKEKCNILLDTALDKSSNYGDDDDGVCMKDVTTSTISS